MLASFGGHGLRLPYAEIARRNGLTILATEQEAGSHDLAHGQRLKSFDRERLSELGLRYEDLVAASDLVVSKPGYGIVSECIANDVALLYTSRGHFAEYDVLVREMPRVLRCGFIPPEDLTAGRWSPFVRSLLEQPAVTGLMPTNGAEIAAEEILSLGAKGRAAT